MQRGVSWDSSFGSRWKQYWDDWRRPHAIPQTIWFRCVTCRQPIFGARGFVGVPKRNREDRPATKLQGSPYAGPTHLRCPDQSIPASGRTLPGSHESSARWRCAGCYYRR
ncbi:hypothetical protein BDV98DRAFT_564188 [Pterulicium gracile]|uniref:Uncharacterized protein n=1 Tax=Pterulicium gracile TaxID=1884261 RepID=A0A5C3QN83_9AGAR|nr:hypothetical protein BDV98DRAFT_564188 [Pterula gracilis]